MKQLDPLVVSSGEVVVNLVVGFEQLTCQRAVDAPPAAVDAVHVGHAGIGPRLQGVDTVEGAELLLSVEFPHVVSTQSDDLSGQVALVGEVVREL